MTTYMRFAAGGKERIGRLEGETLNLVEGDFPGNFRESGERFPLSGVERLLSPIAAPRQVVAIGLNYRDHAAESGHAEPKEPVMWLLASSSLTGHESGVKYPSATQKLGYEAELAVIIGKTCFQAPEAKALEYVFGYTCANDVSARDIQRQDGQWGRAKSYPTFTPIGPRVVTGIDPRRLGIAFRLNGETKQQSNTEQMIFPVPRLIAFLSSFMALHPGDIIITGTPGGVGLVKVGDVMEVEIEGLGILRNRVE